MLVIGGYLRMGKGRLEAFSDGVIAIIITIMVLDLKIPQGTDLAALRPEVPALLSYLLSFIYVGIYWNNHHHMMQAAQTVNGRILWSNLHLLFWLSLIPFFTRWMGENHLAPTPVALYGAGLLMAGVAYYILSRALISHHGKDSTLAVALGKDYKGMFSVAMYIIATLLSFVDPRISLAIYVTVALLWIIPDRRFEKAVAQ
jgi:uncharacterized membrane protein